MQKIEAKIMNVNELFIDKKYIIEHFQRDYSWEKGHIQDLIDDLFNEFRLQKENDDEPSTYFLGPIIVSEEYDKLSLIDGQQRLTSLSLILIWIARAYPEISQDILPLIFKKEGDEEICTLHVEERTPFMKFLYNDEEFSASDVTSTSVQNIIKRFENINSNLREIPKNETIEFMNWLKNYVYVAQIKTASEKDADKIFESANDRGVKLSPVDMFKSYILSNVKPDDEKEKLDKIWRYRMAEINNAKESDESAIKCWLRSSHAESYNDFDEIGGDFHRWIKRKVKSGKIGLKESDDFSHFIEVNFDFYTHWYLESNSLAKEIKTGNEAIFCNQTLQYTFQHQIILSSINPSDNDETVLKKIKLVSTFIDILIARRLWNRKPVSHSSLESYMRNLIDLIRGEKLNKILSVLLDKLTILEEEEEFNYNTTPRPNRYRIFLARFSSWLDEEMGNGNLRLYSYIKGKGYDVEHIIPNNYKNYIDIMDDNSGENEFIDTDDFQEHRNSFGALLLLSSSNNRSYNAQSYEEKLIYYIDQDMVLAKTLCRSAYERNPKLKQINEKYKIKFEPHDNFLKRDIIKRERVYTRLAQAIWNSKKLHEIIN